MTEESGVSIPPQVVSLDLELALLSGATRGAQTLADLLAQKALDGRMERDAPTGIFSILALVRNRIELLRRCIRNEMDPAHLWAPHNAVEDPAVSGEFPEDIILFSWDSLRAPMIMWNVRVEGRGAKGTEGDSPRCFQHSRRGPEGTRALSPVSCLRGSTRTDRAGECC
jgi:hypothetical protein